MDVADCEVPGAGDVPQMTPLATPPGRRVAGRPLACGTIRRSRRACPDTREDTVTPERLRADRSETGTSTLYVLYVIIAVLVIIVLLRILGVV